MLQNAKALLALCLLATGCATSAKVTPPPLPFHIAVVPVSVEREDDVDSDAAVQLSLEARHLSEWITSQLGTSRFERSTLLDFPEDWSRDDFLKLPTPEQNDHWVMEAALIEADLILTCEVNYKGNVQHHANSSAWGNGALFLVGGPFCWVLDDRDYEFEARIAAQVHDMSVLRNPNAGASLENDLADLTGSIQRSHEQTSLDFMDRADGNVGSYLLSVIWPATFLANEAEAVDDALEADIMSNLCDGLTDELWNRRSSLTDSSGTSPFGAEQLAIVADGEKRLLSGTVKLDLSKLDSMDTYRVECDNGKVIEASFGDRHRAESHPSRSDIAIWDLSIALPDGVETARLVLTAGDLVATRSFTLGVGTMGTRSASARAIEAPYKP